VLHALDGRRGDPERSGSTRPDTNDDTRLGQNRLRFNALVANGRADTAEAAALFYYLNRTGYNGLCRSNRRGEFNVPFGRYEAITYRTDFKEYEAALATWQFTSGDFEQVALDPDDFVYADPSYDVEFTKYSKEGFSWRDQVRVAEWLACHRGPVVLSNQATPQIVEIDGRKTNHVIRLADEPRSADT
jgi:DNA adenine methylase